MPKKEFTEVTYTCKCGHKQTVRYFPDDAPFPALCCVNCRAGFNRPENYGQMSVMGIGILAGKPVHV